MKRIFYTYVFICLSATAFSQYKVKLSDNASVGVSTNIETYFFAEKLAVEHIDNFVFNHKNGDYSHQPIVYFGLKNFIAYKDRPYIIRAAKIIGQLRDTLHDNAPILDYLLNQKDFPAKGSRFPLQKANKPDGDDYKLQLLYAELADSLRKFYVDARVNRFLSANKAFYQGALAEVEKDINKPAFSYMEKWYGKKFPAYELYIAPAMPITAGEDSYRGCGPQIIADKGIIPSMLISSSKMLRLQQKLSAYRQFGFDNRPVTSFISLHEILHSFVNPLLDQYSTQIKADSILFTPELSKLMQSHYINDWNVTIIEHLVRLSEIRIAIAMNNPKEAQRLRALHIGEFHCVLIPLLEKKIEEYEQNRSSYPDFKGYLPKLIVYLHNLSPEIINAQIAANVPYKQKP